MLSKIFRAQKSGQAAFLLMLASILSYGAGIFRDRILSTTFGATKLTDAYNASFLIPDFLFNILIAGALSVAFVPVFTSYLKIDKKEAEQVANTVITFGTIFLAILGVIFFFLVPFIIPAVFSQISAEEHTLIITMTRILLLAPIIFCVSNALGSILITHKNFLAYALSGFLYNIGIIFGIILLNEQFGIYSAAIGAIIGVFFHLMIRVLNILTLKYKYRPQLSLRHPGIKQIFKLMIPKSIQLMGWQITLWVYTATAYSLAEGSVAAFNYARNLQSFPISLFGIAFASSIFPFLSDHAHHEATRKFSNDFQVTLERILFFSLPAMIGMILLNQEIIEIILKGGAFDATAVYLTSTVLFYFIISIPIENSIHLFARGYYAYKNTLYPMIFSITGAAANITFSIIGSQHIGVIAIPIGWLIGAAIQLTLLVIFFHARLKFFELSKFVIKFGKILVATILMGIVVKLLPNFINFGFLTTQILRVIVGASLFLLVAFILKCEELKIISNLIKRATSSK